MFRRHNWRKRRDGTGNPFGTHTLSHTLLPVEAQKVTAFKAPGIVLTLPFGWQHTGRQNKRKPLSSGRLLCFYDDTVTSSKKEVANAHPMP